MLQGGTNLAPNSISTPALFDQLCAYLLPVEFSKMLAEMGVSGEDTH